MKMGNRRLKRLDKLANQIFRKPRLTAEPANRAERRALKRALKREEKQK